MPNPFHAARFVTSVRDFNQLPADTGREVVFAGRSNAGKSSALNVLTGHKGLARTSKTPGRTQMINFFEIAPQRYFVDLPGYGYAHVPSAVRNTWRQLLERYFNERQVLRGACVLMDIRHPLTDLDRQMLGWCESRAVPLHVLLTKADKLSRAAAANVLRTVQSELRRDYIAASVQLFSALSGAGVGEARAIVAEWLFAGAA